MRFPARFASACLVLLCLPSALNMPAQDTAAAPGVTNRGEQQQSDIDPEIAAVLNSTRAIDNHAHPVLPPPEMATDRNFDALPVDNMEPDTDPVAWRPDSPQLAQAWRALWGFDGKPPLGPDQMQALDAARARVRTREGAAYDRWVLDQAGIQTMMANRVIMGSLASRDNRASFLWVPYVDALLFPFTNPALQDTPDKKQFFPLEERVRAMYLEESGLRSMPSTLEGYLSQVVTPEMQRLHQGGAVAVKFEVAYLRPFGFAEVSQAEAARVYAKAASGGHLTEAEERALEDFLFRTIALEAGRKHMAVHLHCMSGGGGYFSIAGANPLLLEPLFNDPTLRGTNFVLLHGGWPFVREAGALLQKPNVYLDLSQQSLTFPPHALAGWLREWLETYPDKVLYGTDGYPFTPSLGWEESLWIANHNAREALGIALTGMVRDGEVSRARAVEIARMVLRGSAEKLYGITDLRSATAPSLH